MLARNLCPDNLPVTCFCVKAWFGLAGAYECPKIKILWSVEVITSPGRKKIEPILQDFSTYRQQSCEMLLPNCTNRLQRLVPLVTEKRASKKLHLQRCAIA